MKKILLAGYYGFGNLGDEAILEMTLKQILHITDKKNIVVLSGNKRLTHKKYGIKAINRYNVFSIIYNLIKSDVLVFGGGSLLQDITSKRSIYYYLYLIKLAEFMHNKIVLLSQGIGPLISEKSKNAVRNTLKKADFITVRDKHSMELLEEMGLDKNKVFLSADPVINLREGENTVNKTSRKKRVCFSLRNWKDVNISSKIINVARRLIANNIECHFVPFYYSEDMELIYEVENSLSDSAFYYKDHLSTNEAFDIIKSMDVMVGARLHSLIFAAAANVPFVAVSYDHKVDHFAHSLSMKVSSSIDNIQENILFEEIMDKINNEDSEKKILFENVSTLRKLIDINYEILKEI